MSDNFKFEIISEGEILPALQCLERYLGHSSVRFFKEDVYNGSPRLIFFWPLYLNEEGIGKLITESKPSELSQIISRWLENCEYPPEPDQDGSNRKGWLITTGDLWGHAEDCHEGCYSAFYIQPSWQMYGK